LDGTVNRLAANARMRSLAFSLWNLVGYQAGWFASVLGAASGRFWLGPVVVLVLAGIHVALMRDRLLEVWLLVICGVFGFGVDSFQAYVGVFGFLDAYQIPWLAPPWLVAVWVIFATTLHGCLAWLEGRYWLGALFGLIGGPLAYWGGERLGAVTFGPSMVRDLGIVGVVWAVATPVLLLFSKLTRVPEPRA
jgi:Protein of unknown function (DUF2878)